MSDDSCSAAQAARIVKTVHYIFNTTHSSSLENRLETERRRRRRNIYRNNIDGATHARRFASAERLDIGYDTRRRRSERDEKDYK